MSNGTDIQRIFNPLLEVTLPGDMEQEAGGPQEDDCHVTKVGSEDLLMKILLGYPIVAFKVVARGYPVPYPTCCRVLSEVLAKFWKFCCHRLLVNPLSFSHQLSPFRFWLSGDR